MSIRKSRKVEKKYYFPRLIIILFIVVLSLGSYYLLLSLGLGALEQGGCILIGFNDYGEMYIEIIQFFLIFMFILIGGSFLIYKSFKELKYNNR